MNWVVEYCNYDNGISADFPETCKSLHVSGLEVGSCFIAARNKPPIVVGNYVSGKGFYRTLQDDGQRVLIVSELRIFSGKGQKMLADYSTR